MQPTLVRWHTCSRTLPSFQPHPTSAADQIQDDGHGSARLIALIAGFRVIGGFAFGGKSAFSMGENAVLKGRRQSLFSYSFRNSTG